MLLIKMYHNYNCKLAIFANFKAPKGTNIQSISDENWFHHYIFLTSCLNKLV